MPGTQEFRYILAQKVTALGTAHPAIQVIVEEEVYGVDIGELETILAIG